MVAPLRVGIAGLGTVGVEVVRLLERQGRVLTERTGRPVRVVAVTARSKAKKRGIDLSGIKWAKDALALASDPDVDCLVELMGGAGDPALSAIDTALKAGKSVVTANKALIAKHGLKLAKAAEKHGGALNFEAAVGAAIPVIKTLREGLAGTDISRVYGILNGTCNYILTRMEQEGLSFEACLADAQRLGYAEADPTFDIEGVDAAHKVTLMSAIAFGMPVQFDRAHVEGITKLSAIDIKYAEELGYRIKLLGITRRRDEGVELRVHPTLVPASRLIANVEGAMNAVLVQGDAVGATLYYGKGAGAEPTASAVIADLVDVTRLHTADPNHRVPHLAFQPDELSNVPVLPIDEVTSSYYLRMRVSDETGVLAEITRILAEAGISIDAMLQKESREGEPQTDIIILTHLTREKHVNAAIRSIEALQTVLSPVTRLRMEELN